MISSLSQQYLALKKQIEQLTLNCGRDVKEVQLIAVSKTCATHAIQQVYESGCRDFGENRVQELLDKQNFLKPDINWHFIGTLQSNKVNKLIPHARLIHSVDHFRLAQKIAEISDKQNLITSILLQVNVSGETTKHGLNEQEWSQLLKKVDSLPGLQLEGLMTMAPLTDNRETIRHCFRRLRQLRDQWQQELSRPDFFKHLSMGMTQDYSIAIEEGATLLRLGSAIFNRQDSRSLF